MRVSPAAPARWAWQAAGCLMLALGVLGAVLPLMPTTVFLLLALACFGRSSPQWAARLLAHPQLGPPLQHWQQHGVVPVRGKVLACSGMALGFVVLASRQPGLGWLLAAAVLELAVAGWLLCQPSRPGDTRWQPRWPASRVAATLSVLAHLAVIASLLWHPPAPPTLTLAANPATVMTLTSMPQPLATRTATAARPDSRRQPAPARQAKATPLLHTTQPAARQQAIASVAKPAPATADATASAAPQATPAPAARHDSVAAAPPSPSLPPGQAGGGNSRSWEAQVLARLERFRRYPAGARAQGHEGVVYLQLKVGRDGQILALQLLDSSGHTSLDQAALETVQRAAPLPRLPADRPDSVTVTLPVEFFLD